jgi:hypothetical protein
MSIDGTTSYKAGTIVKFARLNDNGCSLSFCSRLDRFNSYLLTLSVGWNTTRGTDHELDRSP